MDVIIRVSFSLTPNAIFLTVSEGSSGYCVFTNETKYIQRENECSCFTETLQGSKILSLVLIEFLGRDVHNLKRYKHTTCIPH